MQRTLIIYESKYGSTKEIAKNISLIMGNSRYCTVEEFKPEYKNFEFFIIASPVYKEKLNDKVINFVKSNLEWLSSKKTALFCTCSAGAYGVKYLNELKSLLENNLVGIKALGGNVILDKLSKEDYDSMIEFYKKIQHPVTDTKMFSLRTIIDFALRMREMRDRNIIKAPETVIKEEIKKFIETHNTCALATAYDRRVRSTPMEYSYKDGYLYFITEGGEKFANILQNNNVSISIYNNFTNMSSVEGIQIAGEADIVDYRSHEYYDVLKLKGIKEEQLESLSIMINVLKVKIDRAEFLHSKFKSMNYDSKQIVTF